MKKLFIRFRSYLPVILVLGVLLIPEVGFAQNLPGVSTAQGSDTLKGLADVLGLVISVLTFLALLMINFFGELLGTDMITGVEAMEAIRPMWMWVRNLTNILFVGVLLFLAFSNLFSSLGVGGEGGNWTIKEKLPKLIIAIVAINFSLLGFKLVIDAINVGTVAILGIADHRLEPDMTGLQETLNGTRTWIKIDEDREKAIRESLGEDNVEEILTENIAGGNDCGTQWKDLFKEGNTCADLTVDKSKCLLLAKDVGSDIFVCRGFTESINDLFCSDWISKEGDSYSDQAGGDDKCLFMMKKDSFSTMITPTSEPGQNLFAAFGSVFMHLEKLPALGAEINSLGAVVTNTLFSALLAIAFIVALVAVFIAMVARVILLWVVLVFSPLLVGASILGVDGGKGGDISAKIVTHLVMPLKVAAAFAVGFVMMSAMVEWKGEASETAFVFGPALSQLGVNEYAFLWQIATIVLFWMVAFWAVEGSLADKLVQGVKSSAELLAETTAKTLTVDRPMFSVGTGTEKSQFSLGSVLAAPQAIANAKQARDNQMKATMAQALGITQSDYAKSLQGKKFSSIEEYTRHRFSASSKGEAASHWKAEEEALRNSKLYAMADLVRDTRGDAAKMDAAIKDDPTKFEYSADKKPFFATAASYGKPVTAPETPTGKENKIKDDKAPTVTVASSNGESNKVSYDGTDGNKINNKELVTAIKDVSVQDGEQIVDALAKMGDKIIYTKAEKQLLQSKTESDGTTSLWSRLMKSDKAGLFPGMSGDGTALEVEIINADGIQKPFEITSNTKIEQIPGYKTLSGETITEKMLEDLKKKIKKDE